MPLRDNMKVAGIAFTIKSSSNTVIRGEMDTRAKMLSEIHEDAICVWDSSGDTESALWGEVMTATVRGKGVRGAVIDGGLRDTMQVLAQNFPVFYKYRTSNGSLGRCLITAYQTIVKIGKVMIRPGDVIFGDIDGVVVIPRDIAYEVLVRAEEITVNEKEIREWIEEGLSATEIVEKGGYF
jgi:regulator of RNase E activity RraA